MRQTGQNLAPVRGERECVRVSVYAVGWGVLLLWKFYSRQVD